MQTLHQPSFSTWVVGGGPDQRVGRGVHGFEFHGWYDGVVGTHPQHLLSPHQDPVETFARVIEDLQVTDAALLPLAEVAVPSVQLGALLEQDLLILLSRFGLHLRGAETRSYPERITSINVENGKLQYDSSV